MDHELAMSHSFRQITPTDHFGWHAAYLEVYEKLFAHFKAWTFSHGDRIVRILEIGTDGGGGLLMYYDNFRQCIVHGIDISPTPECVKRYGIFHTQGDAYTQDTLSFYRAMDLFDIIIDDGPHTIGSQEFFVQHYPHLLTGDGIAIVEDIQEPHHATHLASLVPEGFFSMVVDLRHVNGRYDDVLLVIFRK